MSKPLPEELTDAVYRTALEPNSWREVMHLMKTCFPSTAQTFYFLDLKPHRVRPVCLAGVDARWLESFDELYFAPDNPWIRLTRQLHRPGVVRTNERLDRFLRDDGVLYRSAYYNEWMRPQGFKYTIGNTLLAESGMVANITLFRSPDMATFSNDEFRAFERLSKHMTRSLQMALRIEQPQKNSACGAALEAIPQAVALVDAQQRVLFANQAMETLFRRKHGLTVHHGKIDAVDPATQPRLAGFLGSAFAPDHGLSCDLASLVVPCDADQHLNLRVVPVGGAKGPYLPLRPTALLLATECDARATVSWAQIRDRYGCTATEARLAQHVVQGHRLRQSADMLGITYETARVYLKLVFQKVGVHTQAQLVAQVLGDAHTATKPTAPRTW